MEHGSVGADTLGDAKAAIFSSKRGGTVDVPVIEAGASLAAYGEGIFKPGRGDEGYARTLALEESVGGDGGTVADFDGGIRYAAGNFANRFKDGAAGIVWSGRKLEDIDAAADAVDAVSEGAAGVDGDGEVRGHTRKHNRQGRRGNGTVDREGRGMRRWSSLITDDG